jgi:CDP-diacylglycerol--glycerol-3-phosphate 3-phosphatidyltransferase
VKGGLIVMLSRLLRLPFVAIITPLCRLLLKLRISPNAVTFFGAVASCVASLLTFPFNHLEWGTWLVTAFVLFDLLDGTMARLSSVGASLWGAFLDSTLDRVSDGALLIALALYANKYAPRLLPVILIALLAGSLVSYLRARAEGLGLECKGGIAERTDRLIVALVATGFAGLGVHYIFAVGMWILASASVITVLQRYGIIYQQTRLTSHK